MRYLIFNITVLAALGYLLTGGPNQSFTQWAVAKLDVWGTPAATAKPADQGVVETGKTFAKAVAKVTSEKLEALDPDASYEAAIVSDVAEMSGSAGQPSDSTNALEKKAMLDADEIKNLILAVLSEVQLNAEQNMVVARDTTASRVSDLASVQEIKPTKTPTETSTASAEMSDEEIEAAFKAFEKPQNERSNATMAAEGESGLSVVTTDGSGDQTPAFMSRADRAADMSKIIQQLNILYLEKVGI